MVATQKRKRAIVSYREPSSDEDLGESASEAQPSRTRNRNKRARPSTRNRSPSPRTKPTPPQARCRNAQAAEGSTAGKRTGRALRQSKQRAVSYKDISSDEDDDFEVEQEEVVERRQPRRPTAQPNRPHRSTQSKKTGTPRKSLGAPRKPNTGMRLVKEMMMRASTNIGQRKNQLHPSCKFQPTEISPTGPLFLITYFSKYSSMHRTRYMTTIWRPPQPSLGCSWQRAYAKLLRSLH